MNCWRTFHQTKAEHVFFKSDDSYQGLVEREKGKLLFNRYRVSVPQDEKVLASCFTTMQIDIVNTTKLYTSKWLRR